MANLAIKTKGERTKERICLDLGINADNFDLKISQLFGQLNIQEGILIIESDGTESDYKCYLDKNPSQFLNFRITRRCNKKDYPRFKIINIGEENEFTFISDSVNGTINWENRTYCDDIGKKSICTNDGQSCYSFKQLIGDNQLEVVLNIKGKIEQCYGDLKLMQAYLLSIEQPVNIDIVAGDLCTLASEDNPICEIMWTEKADNKIVNLVHVKNGKVIQIVLEHGNGQVLIMNDGTQTFNTDQYAITLNGEIMQYSGVLTPNIDDWTTIIRNNYDQAIVAIHRALLLKEKLLALKTQ